MISAKVYVFKESGSLYTEDEFVFKENLDLLFEEQIVLEYKDRYYGMVIVVVADNGFTFMINPRYRAETLQLLNTKMI